MDESETIDRSFDEVQAVRASLCFLCRINADYIEVEQFLTSYPDALLFEEAQMEGRAQAILIEQMQQCSCFVQACNENRRMVMELLHKGFEYYRDRNLSRHRSSMLYRVNSSFHFYFEQLRNLEHDLREIGSRDVEVRNRISELRAEVKVCRLKLEGVSRKEHGKSRQALSLLVCQRKTNIFEKRSSLENKLGTATLSIASLEDELNLLEQERIAAKKLQAAIQKNAFAGCQRHVCEASRRNVPRTPMPVQTLNHSSGTLKLYEW